MCATHADVGWTMVELAEQIQQPTCIPSSQVHAAHADNVTVMVTCSARMSACAAGQRLVRQGGHIQGLCAVTPLCTHSRGSDHTRLRARRLDWHRHNMFQQITGMTEGWVKAVVCRSSTCGHPHDRHVCWACHRTLGHDASQTWDRQEGVGQGHHTDRD